MRKINLDKLKTTSSGLTLSVRNFIHEALLVALVQSGHKSGVVLEVKGTYNEKIILNWEISPNQMIRNSWKNQIETVNYAAVALSIMLIVELTPFNYFELAEIGTGIDYWMNKESSISPLKALKKEARLEISGIFKETKSNTVNMRVNLKKKQIKKSNNSGLPAWITVIEFSSPKSKIEKQ